jgi:hypothetical protein
MSNIIQLPIKTKYVIFKVQNFINLPMLLFNTSSFFFLNLPPRNRITKAIRLRFTGVTGATRASGASGASGEIDVTNTIEPSFISQTYC